MTICTNTDLNYEDAPAFKVGDRVRFSNGPVMTVIDVYEHKWVLCYWWVAGCLQEASFPVQVLIHAMTFPGEEDSELIQDGPPDWDKPVFSYKDLEALGVTILEEPGDALNT